MRSLVLAGLVSLLAAACGGGGSPAPQQPGAPAPGATQPPAASPSGYDYDYGY